MKNVPATEGNGRAKIDRNIPIPSRYKSDRWPFSHMEIGDSFFIPARDPAYGTFRAAVSVTSNRLRPKHFICRAVEGGLRVWRDA